MRYATRSVIGRTRKSNHDYAGALCDGDRGLFVITDGTSKLGSGQLAECFVKGVLETYPKHMEQGGDITEHGTVEQVLCSMLAELHPTLFADQTGAMCYLIGFAAHGKLTLAYEGDCSCGVVTPAGTIEWITPPHCKANWRRDRSHRELAQDPARNWITRCLKVNRAPDPDFVFHKLAVGERLVFVTDGFWAELTESQQSSLLAAPDSDFIAVEDDVTWIDVQL
ncbi:PP2C family protein-serine/threonine phosphatase [Pseudomonas svalbardensis]|uniref:PP2C family protein-serine/threonine phosphatase n=1 Tax=Pseudomonas svalbardensis TaxID=3042029 RepID=UPI0024B33938|nr:serine/threonine protein phosphatase [Pseudomonas sp. PMCC200367]